MEGFREEDKTSSRRLMVTSIGREKWNWIPRGSKTSSGRSTLL